MMQVKRSTDDGDSQMYIYPIKSLRAIKVTEAIATAHGFKHDRTTHHHSCGMELTTTRETANTSTGSFMLLQETKDGYKNMAVSSYPEMTQFLQEMKNDTITVKYIACGDVSKETSIDIPLEPDTEKLDPIDINMHSAPTTAHRMPQRYNDWFTSCFGYSVIFVYLGANLRDVKFQDMQPLEPDPLTRFLSKYVPFTKSYVEKVMGLHKSGEESWKITFADCAPYLFTSQTSLEDVSSRLPEGMDMDIEKFRPNVVVEGAYDPYQEDYWGKLTVNGRTEIILPHNCVRCKSINIDHKTGKPGEGPAGEVLKRLQKDRRVDIGAKWSPVFGRYGFWGSNGKKTEEVWRVGDRVNVAKVNEGLTVWSKFFHGGANDDARVLSLTVCRLAWRWVVVCKVVLPECTSTGNGIRADIHNYESILLFCQIRRQPCDMAYSIASQQVRVQIWPNLWGARKPSTSLHTSLLPVSFCLLYRFFNS